MAITMINAPDTMYGGAPNPNGPNAAFLSGNGTFTIQTWTGSIQPGTTGNPGDVQLYIRQWNLVSGSWVGQSVWASGWDGANQINYDGQLGQMQPGPASKIWPIGATFQVSPTQQWSILAQTGPVSGAEDTSTGMNASFDAGSGNLTFNGVSGPSGTGNIVVVIDANQSDDV